ncbi:MAG: hypothetical protein NTW67_05975 [Candidatus Woesearchaeota archaeon]|nr:hypothetical protein [Candidatus Woesearchaeota archaeon]
MKYWLLLIILLSVIAEAQYYPQDASDSATINIRIGEEPTPPQRQGGGSAASTSYSGVSSVSKNSVQQQTQTAATTAPPPIEQPVEARETFREYNPDLQSGQMPASTTTMEYAKVPYWFVWLAGIALIFLIVLLWKLHERTSKAN